MTRHLTRTEILGGAAIHAQPASPPAVDRCFGLPRRLYAATVGLYLAFIATLGFGLATPGLAVPIAICAIIVTAAFAVPSLWATMQPPHTGRPLAWSRFASEGIVALTGRVRAGDAVVQVLLLPVLICVWGAIVVTIVALS